MSAGRQAVWIGALAGLMMLAGCSVHVNKGGNGEDKDVSIHTPFGGMQVHNNKGDAATLGLPAYPGAVLEADSHNGAKDGGDKDGGDKSVDVQMGFGPWQMHVQVVNYSTGDPQLKVQEFYRKALSRYGDVLLCQGQNVIGTPTRTGEGLTCRDTTNRGNVMNVGSDANLELKAGSERKQHVVVFNQKSRPGTHFSLVALTLPPKDGGSDKEE